MCSKLDSQLLAHSVMQCIEEDELIAALHARAEKFDERAEFTFGYLQVFSAICVVFAHGAGERTTSSICAHSYKNCSCIRMLQAASTLRCLYA